MQSGYITRSRIAIIHLILVQDLESGGCDVLSLWLKAFHSHGYPCLRVVVIRLSHLQEQLTSASKSWDQSRSSVKRES